MLKKHFFSTTREITFLVSRPALWFRRALSKADLQNDPNEQFSLWYADASRTLFSEFPNGMCLSTIGKDGYPNSRMVLLKSHDAEGFVFYTNTKSTKGEELAACPKAALNFYWDKLQRQVRVFGDVLPVDLAEADAYFSSRPRMSQIGAWASLQSTVLKSREELTKRFAEFERKYEGQDIPRPEYWSGYRLIPKEFEFWELRLGRLHDRFVYRKLESSWKIERLSP